MRFDDTNPRRKSREYVDSIRMVRWLGLGWGDEPRHLYHASDFDFMYRAVEASIEAGRAYVDEQTPEEMRANRGDFQHAGHRQPVPDRSPTTCALFREMRDGWADGAMVLRAKIDMASAEHQHARPDDLPHPPRHAPQHRRPWCIYPMYTFAHPIEDALERITHSICTLEFEDQRPFYDWLLDPVPTSACWPARCQTARVCAAQPQLRRHQQAQAAPAGGRRPCERLGRPRMPPSSACAAVASRPQSIRAMVEHRRDQAERLDRDAVLDGCLRADLEPPSPARMACFSR